MEYYATFFTHSGAMKYSKHLKEKNIESEISPVPRKYSSNCGIGVRFQTDLDMKNLINSDMEKLYKIDNKDSILIYTAE